MNLIIYVNIKEVTIQFQKGFYSGIKNISFQLGSVSYIQKYY